MADMGRPFEYDPEEVREIRLPRFPRSLHDRFTKMGQDRKEKVVDMVRWIITKELNSKFAKRPPLQIKKNEKYLNRKFRNISISDWNQFQVKALYYDRPATDILMELIQEEVLRHEKQTALIRKYSKPFTPNMEGTLNFTLKLPKANMTAIVEAGKKKSKSAIEVVREAIKKVDDPEYRSLKEFNQEDMKDMVQRRLVGISKKSWTKFREFCIMKNANTNRMLITFINYYISKG